MSEITAAMVKELREKTGAGMMDCKAALAEAGGDMDKAIESSKRQRSSRPEPPASVHRGHRCRMPAG